jgi:O-6-methylguanine DNA methyltransferase
VPRARGSDSFIDVREAIAIGAVESPFGALRLAASERGIVRLLFPRGSGRGLTDWLATSFPDAGRVDWLPALDKARQELDEYFAGRRTEFTVPLDLRGTEFQLAVWQGLRDIPYGQTRSYVEVARAIGRPSAVRAVGGANNANPVAIVVPCHRVINADGTLGGYGGGLDIKRRLLALERAALPGEALL